MFVKSFPALIAVIVLLALSLPVASARGGRGRHLIPISGHAGCEMDPDGRVHNHSDLSRRRVP